MLSSAFKKFCLGWTGECKPDLRCNTAGWQRTRMEKIHAGWLIKSPPEKRSQGAWRLFKAVSVLKIN